MSAVETADGPQDQAGDNEQRELTPAARRALAEAEERRQKRETEEAAAKREREHGGRAGPDPVRYGDWENGGIASDF